jgi:hypothetical protein
VHKVGRNEERRDIMKGRRKKKKKKKRRGVKGGVEGRLYLFLLDYL